MVGIGLAGVLALRVLTTFVANLIIVRGTEDARVRSTIPLKLSIDSNFTVRRVKVTRTRLLIHEAHDVSLTIRVELTAARPLRVTHLVALLLLLLNITGTSRLHAHSSSLLFPLGRRFALHPVHVIIGHYLLDLLFH